ncbi:toll/interleukin-1 receptor domain-containing protein [Alcanivorax sp.]|uniref:toll/interleukin-1 receptor domain-containing protein n=1 Tax=Alcanivorax sp. TaxID=1872427 RepID=UPI0026216D55|nr:toll/interleukin-1 receptor domain-containing protein [Alcanivorax sp.]
MPIDLRTLRSASTRSRQVVVANSLYEARARNKQTAFLCHSHTDQQLAQGLQVILKEHGWDLYIDWQDHEMPESPNKETAIKIKSKILETDWFLFLATPNSVRSRWCPWEIGYADSTKTQDKILIVPTQDDSGKWFGNEYLELYKRLDKGYQSNKSGYAVFKPGAQYGTFVSQIR